MKLALVLFTSLILIQGCATRRPTSEPESILPITSALIDYPAIFAKAREVTLIKGVPQKKALKNIVESDLIDYLQKFPEKMSEEREQLFKAIEVKKEEQNPSKTVRLFPPEGEWGYSELKYAVNHPYFIGGQLRPASDLVKAWANFIEQAKSKIILNVFEFNLQIVADKLAQKAAEGVDVRVGIDDKVAKLQPQVKSIIDFLTKNNVKVVLVNSVGLNHQKMVAIDWDNPSNARVLFSSGNLTQSCLGPEGDLKELSPRPKESIPNANHLLTMKSWPIANLVAHELLKILGPLTQLRGEQIPITGAYQITGPEVDPKTRETNPENSLIISFSPGGGLRSINKNLLGNLVEKTNGPFRLVQFAYSSSALAEGLLKKAIENFNGHGDFDFGSVGDTPFAMREWSQFLKMSALKREEDAATNTVKYVEENQSPWYLGLGSRNITRLRKRVRIAPKIYGNHKIRINNKSYDVTSKIHHKIMRAGDFAVLGTSYNFSESAENNNEQILIFNDKKMAALAEGIYQYLRINSRRSVFDEAMARNQKKSQSIDPGVPAAPESLELTTP